MNEGKSYRNNLGKNQERQCTVLMNLTLGEGGLSRYQFCGGKTVSISYFECMSVIFVMRHAVRMRRIILSSVSCLAVPYFPTFNQKQHEFRGKILLNKKLYVLIFSTIFF